MPRVHPDELFVSVEQRGIEKEQHLTSTALLHVIGGLIALGYAQNYYFHLRKLDENGALE